MAIDLPAILSPLFDQKMTLTGRMEKGHEVHHSVTVKQVVSCCLKALRREKYPVLAELRGSALSDRLYRSFSKAEVLNSGYRDIDFRIVSIWPEGVDDERLGRIETVIKESLMSHFSKRLTSIECDYKVTPIIRGRLWQCRAEVGLVQISLMVSACELPLRISVFTHDSFYVRLNEKPLCLRADKYATKDQIESFMRMLQSEHPKDYALLEKEDEDAIVTARALRALKEGELICDAPERMGRGGIPRLLEKVTDGLHSPKPGLIGDLWRGQPPHELYDEIIDYFTVRKQVKLAHQKALWLQLLFFKESFLVEVQGKIYERLYPLLEPGFKLFLSPTKADVRDLIWPFILQADAQVVRFHGGTSALRLSYGQHFFFISLDNIPFQSLEPTEEQALFLLKAPRKAFQGPPLTADIEAYLKALLAAPGGLLYDYLLREKLAQKVDETRRLALTEKLLGYGRYFTEEPLAAANDLMALADPERMPAPMARNLLIALSRLALPVITSHHDRIQELIDLVLRSPPPEEVTERAATEAALLHHSSQSLDVLSRLIANPWKMMPGEVFVAALLKEKDQVRLVKALSLAPGLFSEPILEPLLERLASLPDQMALLVKEMAVIPESLARYAEKALLKAVSSLDISYTTLKTLWEKADRSAHAKALVQPLYRKAFKKVLAEESLPGPIFTAVQGEISEEQLVVLTELFSLKERIKIDAALCQVVMRVSLRCRNFDLLLAAIHVAQEDELYHLIQEPFFTLPFAETKWHIGTTILGRYKGERWLPFLNRHLQIYFNELSLRVGSGTLSTDYLAELAPLCVTMTPEALALPIWQEILKLDMKIILTEEMWFPSLRDNLAFFLEDLDRGRRLLATFPMPPLLHFKTLETIFSEARYHSLIALFTDISRVSHPITMTPSTIALSEKVMTYAKSRAWPLKMLYPLWYTTLYYGDCKYTEEILRQCLSIHSPEASFPLSIPCSVFTKVLNAGDVVRFAACIELVKESKFLIWRSLFNSMGGALFSVWFTIVDKSFGSYDLRVKTVIADNYFHFLSDIKVKGKLLDQAVNFSLQCLDHHFSLTFLAPYLNFIQSYDLQSDRKGVLNATCIVMARHGKTIGETGTDQEREQLASMMKTFSPYLRSNTKDLESSPLIQYLSLAIHLLKMRTDAELEEATLHLFYGVKYESEKAVRDACYCLLGHFKEPLTIETAHVLSHLLSRYLLTPINFSAEELISLMREFMRIYYLPTCIEKETLLVPLRRALFDMLKRLLCFTQDRSINPVLEKALVLVPLVCKIMRGDLESYADIAAILCHLFTRKKPTPAMGSAIMTFYRELPLSDIFSQSEEQAGDLIPMALSCRLVIIDHYARTFLLSLSGMTDTDRALVIRVGSDSLMNVNKRAVAWDIPVTSDPCNDSSQVLLRICQLSKEDK